MDYEQMSGLQEMAMVAAVALFCATVLLWAAILTS